MIDQPTETIQIDQSFDLSFKSSIAKFRLIGKRIKQRNNTIKNNFIKFKQLAKQIKLKPPNPKQQIQIQFLKVNQAIIKEQFKQNAQDLKLNQDKQLADNIEKELKDKSKQNHTELNLSGENSKFTKITQINSSFKSDLSSSVLPQYSNPQFSQNSTPKFLQTQKSFTVLPKDNVKIQQKDIQPNQNSNIEQKNSNMEQNNCKISTNAQKLTINPTYQIKQLPSFSNLNQDSISSQKLKVKKETLFKFCLDNNNSFLFRPQKIKKNQEKQISQNKGQILKALQDLRAKIFDMKHNSTKQGQKQEILSEEIQNVNKDNIQKFDQQKQNSQSNIFGTIQKRVGAQNCFQQNSHLSKFFLFSGQNKQVEREEIQQKRKGQLPQNNFICQNIEFQKLKVNSKFKQNKQTIIQKQRIEKKKKNYLYK